jgi:hypothetical protein
MVVYQDENLPEEFPIHPNYVRASNTVFWKFERLPRVGGVDQTCVTLTQQADLKGFIPKAVVKKGAIGLLLDLSHARKVFDRSLEIDAGTRASLVEMIRNHAGDYSEEENMIIEGGLENFFLFESLKAKSVKMDVPSTTAKIAFKKDDSHAWGWGSTIVRATPEEVLSYATDHCSRATQKGDDIERSVDEVPNGHSQLLYIQSVSPNDKIIEFLSTVVWKKNINGEISIVFSPAESERRKRLPGVVRARYPSAMKISRLNNQATKIEYIIHPDYGGDVPKWAMNFYTARDISYVSEIWEYFQSLRGLNRWDAEDGKAVGEVMMARTKEEKHREKGETRVDARMRELFKKYKGLKDISSKYEFFRPMMARVVQNKLSPAGDVDTKLCNVSAKQGGMIGAGLAMSLASSLTAEAAVDEWIGKYRSVKELDREEVWFRPMMNVVALRLLGEVSWGLKMRVFLGAFLSVLDMGSDINVILLYLSSPNTVGYGISLLWMLIACIFLQLSLVYGQYKTRPQRMLKEVLIVLTGLKPG